jgi:tricorn protease
MPKVRSRLLVALEVKFGSRRNRLLLRRIAIVFAWILVLSITSNSQTKLLRFPDIRGDRVVFTYGGDLLTAPTTGGTAVHLTTHPGVELFGKF